MRLPLRRAILREVEFFTSAEQIASRCAGLKGDVLVGARTRVIDGGKYFSSFRFPLPPPPPPGGRWWHGLHIKRAGIGPPRSYPPGPPAGAARFFVFKPLKAFLFPSPAKERHFTRWRAAVKGGLVSKYRCFSYFSALNFNRQLLRGGAGSYSPALEVKCLTAATCKSPERTPVLPVKSTERKSFHSRPPRIPVPPQWQRIWQPLWCKDAQKCARELFFGARHVTMPQWKHNAVA